MATAAWSDARVWAFNLFVYCCFVLFVVVLFCCCCCCCCFLVSYMQGEEDRALVDDVRAKDGNVCKVHWLFVVYLSSLLYSTLAWALIATFRIWSCRPLAFSFTTTSNPHFRRCIVSSESSIPIEMNAWSLVASLIYCG
jgi:hypothetical protein